MHAVAAVTPAYRPAAQLSHSSSLRALKVPASHGSQCVAPSRTPVITRAGVAWMVTVPLCPLFVAPSPPKAQTLPP